MLVSISASQCELFEKKVLGLGLSKRHNLLPKDPKSSLNAFCPANATLEMK